jgi:hypothetical protein
VPTKRHADIQLFVDDFRGLEHVLAAAYAAVHPHFYVRTHFGHYYG